MPVAVLCRPAEGRQGDEEKLRVWKLSLGRSRLIVVLCTSSGGGGSQCLRSHRSNRLWDCGRADVTSPTSAGVPSWSGKQNSSPSSSPSSNPLQSFSLSTGWRALRQVVRANTSHRLQNVSRIPGNMMDYFIFSLMHVKTCTHEYIIPGTARHGSSVSGCKAGRQALFVRDLCVNLLLEALTASNNVLLMLMLPRHHQSRRA